MANPKAKRVRARQKAVETKKLARRKRMFAAIVAVDLALVVLFAALAMNTLSTGSQQLPSLAQVSSFAQATAAEAGQIPTSRLPRVPSSGLGSTIDLPVDLSVPPLDVRLPVDLTHNLPVPSLDLPTSDGLALEVQDALTQALPPAAAIVEHLPTTSGRQRMANVNVTFYDCASQGFCGAMYNGRKVYEGAAACSWNLAIGTRFRISGDPTGRVYICEDRGLLTNTWVDIFFYYPADGYRWQAQVGRHGTIEIVN